MKPRLTRRSAFSLVEVAVALALVSFSVIATFGLVVVGLNSSRESADDTVLVTIFQDAAHRVVGQTLRSAGTDTFQFYYDAEGTPVDAATNARAHYEVEVALVDPPAGPASLRAATITARWPVQDGAVVAQPKTESTTTLVTTLTPPQWREVQPEYQEKIEL